MKKILYIFTVVALLALLVMPAFAENKAYDRFSETIRGENESCPMLQSLYVAKTFKDAVKLPIVGKASWRSELSYTSDLNSITGNNSVMIKSGLEF